MNRRGLKDWSRGLSDDDFACALAAAGVADSEGLLRVVNRVTRWRAPDSRAWATLNARKLANAWKKLVMSYTDLRLSIQKPWPGLDPEWVTECLTRPATALGSVSLSPGKWQQPTLLRQPRVSIAGDVNDSSPYEILIVPGGLANAESATGGVTAHAVVTIGGMPDNAEDAAAQLEALRVRSGAGAAAAVSGRDGNQWFAIMHQMLRSGTAFDLALTRSVRAMPTSWRMLLIENEEWLELDAGLSDFKAPIRQGFHPAILLPLPEEEQAEGQRGERLLDSIRSGDELELEDFGPGEERPRTRSPRPRSGRGGGGASLLLWRRPHGRVPDLEELLEPALPRHLQARVSQTKTGAPAFLAGAQHRILVRIGAAESLWITDRRVLDESKLPKSRSGHTLTVVFVEPDLMRKPQLATIHLPPAGPSTTCEFRLNLRGSVQEVAARIAVLYRNRVLQTSLLRGKADGRDAPVLEAEVAVNPAFTGLAEQPHYDAALVFNHTAAGSSKVMGIAGSAAAMINTGDLDKFVQQIEAALADADWGSKEFGSLKAPGTLLLLRKLAAHGREMAKRLEGSLTQLATARRIQLVAAKRGARLPVEYFYSLPTPGPDWQLCPHAAASLAAGGRCKRCSAVKDSAKYLCPLSFWGLSRVLEWQIFRDEAARKLGGSDFELMSAEEPDAVGRKRLDPLRKAVVAASSRVNAEVKNSVPALLTYLKQLDIPVTQTATWKGWLKSLKGAPSLLILMPHTDMDSELGVPKMEIGHEDWLTSDRLEKPYVSVADVRPVVLLLGCDTGQQHVPFEDFVSNFMLNGAAIVVTSASSILGRHAAPLAQEFVRIMQLMSKSEKATFGDVMLQVRQNMMRKGYPMVMSISSYGDADWRL